MERQYLEEDFNLEHVLQEIKHFLPSQMTLKDFIHHNTLHAFQDQKFYDGIFRASKIFGYKVTLQLADYRELFKLGRIKEDVIDRVIEDRMGSNAMASWIQKVLWQPYDENIIPRIGSLRSDWKRVYKIDLDSLVHPLLFRIICAYLDQGISLWNFPKNEGSFLDTIRAMESSSAVSIFTSNAVRQLLLDRNASIEDVLDKIVGDRNYFAQYLFDMCFSHRGWSGMVSILEDYPNAILIKKQSALEDFVYFELLLELDQLETNLHNNWKPLSQTAREPSIDMLAPTENTELNEVLKIWQDAFEWSYYDDVFRGIQTNILKEKKVEAQKKFQAIFCIDERECSIRRHIEYIAPTCETFGAPGFFGVEFYFKPQNAKFMDKLCPVPVTPKYLIKEYNVESQEIHDSILSKSAHGLLWSFPTTIGLGLLSVGKMFQAIFRPRSSALTSSAAEYMNRKSKLTVENVNVNDIEEGLQIGFTIAEMTQRLETFLRGIGFVDNFSDIVYVIGHGSSSANNPFYGAYNCGACSGRPGSVNARVFAIMANHPKVRIALRTNGINIPSTTIFIAGMHDTTSDDILFFDEEDLNTTIGKLHQSFKQDFENALDLDAKERSRRFASIDTNASLKSIRKSINQRSNAIFEPRPELGHGTNALAIIGRRAITQGLFLDRRAFLNSYDYTTDLDGVYLAKVMAPIGIVCGGINLEYYFSRVDNLKLGCGTKLPHNVMGLLGVANSSDGDLRTGLPWQTIEPHDPVRLMVIVEHFPEIVLKVIQSNPEMYEWYKNEWVHIAALHPETKEFFYFLNGHFVHYHPTAMDMKIVENLHHFFEQAPEMMTNHITHATFENLPIYQIENNVL